MKKRFKNWITSIIGIIIMIGAVVWKFLPEYTNLQEGEQISNVEFGTLLSLGWVFLVAKDSLIEGILGNFIKVKKDVEE